jgi:hypothetical protein
MIVARSAISVPQAHESDSNTYTTSNTVLSLHEYSAESLVIILAV